MSLFAHIINRKKDILILVKGPTQGLDDYTMTEERKQALNFSEQQKYFCLSWHYKGANSYLFVNSILNLKNQNKRF